MKYTKCFSLLLSSLMLLSFSGCGMKQMASSGEGGGYTVTDATGKAVVIPAKPKRILGNSASIDTMLLSVVTPDKLTAATDADRDPNISYIAEDTKAIPLTVPLTGLSMEIVTEARPDLIVASTYTDGRELDLYRNLGIPVVVIDGPRSIDQVKEDVRIIAAAAGEKERGENVISQMEQGLSEIDSRLAEEKGKKPVVYLVSQMTRYGGPGSMFNELLTRARIDNAIALAGGVNGQATSPELIIKTDPDMLFVSTDRASDTTGAARYRDDFLANPAIASMRAAGHIVPVEDRYIYSASQNCVWAIKGLANAAYGPLFDMSGEGQIRGY
ncbi:ABC transporter substrate-binding protein [uncultured Dialister sp.]|jgi:iron complex transport system substrate-binding protein|uniref:ABC transporter substrate-binding protein n=1 Tax=uncultured Dialister sp. TaxID=278064 RepID=UPI0025CEE8C3|nr:ABC transporter substrate-binding protein [uncultured Dialister sp.]